MTTLNDESVYETSEPTPVMKRFTFRVTSTDKPDIRTGDILPRETMEFEERPHMVVFGQPVYGTLKPYQFLKYGGNSARYFWIVYNGRSWVLRDWYTGSVVTTSKLFSFAYESPTCAVLGCNQIRNGPVTLKSYNIIRVAVISGLKDLTTTPRVPTPPPMPPMANDIKEVAKSVASLIVDAATVVSDIEQTAVQAQIVTEATERIIKDVVIEIGEILAGETTAPPATVTPAETIQPEEPVETPKVEAKEETVATPMETVETKEETVEAPKEETVEAPKEETVEAPKEETVEAKEETIEAKEETIETPKGATDPAAEAGWCTIC